MKKKKQTECKNQQMWISPKKWYLPGKQDCCVYEITETETAYKRDSGQSWSQNGEGEGDMRSYAYLEAICN